MNSSTRPSHRAEYIAGLLRGAGRRHAWIGLAVSVFAVVAATLMVARYEYNSIAPERLLAAQAGSHVLWLLDILALVFMVWGPYLSVIMARRAGVLVQHETQVLREHTSLLEYELGRAPGAGPFLGLPNRHALLSALEESIHGGSGAALLVLQTDQYHEAASAHGGMAAGELALQLAERLRKVLSAGDYLAHLGHDDFALLRPRRTDEAQARRLASRVQMALDQPLSLGRAALSLRAAVGIALYPAHGTDAEALLRSAETAKFAAAADRRDYQVYEPALDDARSEAPRLVAELHGALHHDGLHEEYKLQVPLHAGVAPRLRLMCGWQHPRRGALDESEFLNLSDRLSLVQSLTLWLLREGLARLAGWREQSGLALGLVVRPPASALRQLPLADLALRLLTAHDLPPPCLTLEFSEAALLEGGSNARQQLLALRAAGVHTGLDGLGQPGASPATPLFYPIDQMRIAPALVGRIAHDAAARQLLEGLLGLLRPLGQQLTLSGVDTETLHSLAQGLPVDYLEGVAVRRRGSPAEIADWVAQQSRAPGAGLRLGSEARPQATPQLV